MQARAEIDPGTCGFKAVVTATVEGGREARFTIASQCEHIAVLAAALAEHEAFDVYAEMDPRAESPLHAVCRESLKGSYPGARSRWGCSRPRRSPPASVCPIRSRSR